MLSDISLRGHHLLCMQHFKGLGYSPEFVENMSTLVDRLRREPDLIVHLVVAPDDVCQPCPNLRHGSCHSDGRNDEASRMAQDRAVLEGLGLEPGDRISWAEVMKRIRFGRDSLPANVCGPCRWLQVGLCGQS